MVLEELLKRILDSAKDSLKLRQYIELLVFLLCIGGTYYLLSQKITGPQVLGLTVWIIVGLWYIVVAYWKTLTTKIAILLIAIAATAIWFASLAFLNSHKPQPLQTISITTPLLPMGSNFAYYPITLLVRVDAPARFNNTSVLYRLGFNEEYPSNNEGIRWDKPPVDVIRGMLLERLNLSLQYRNVRIDDGNTDSDYVLHAILYDFEEVDSPTAPVASIQMRTQLYVLGELALDNTQVYSAPIVKPDPEGLALGFSEAAKIAVERIDESVGQYFKAHPPAHVSPRQK